MARQMVVDYPTYVNFTEAIKIAKKLVSTFKGSVITSDALANALQHKNASSGTFLRKIADLKRLGIIDGRGSVVTTDLAKRIAIPTNEQEKSTAIEEMVFKIQIIKQLHDVFQSNVLPSENEILIQLINITKKDRAELQPITAEVRNLYKDAMQYLTMKPQSSQSGGLSSFENFASDFGGFGKLAKEEQKPASDDFLIVEEGIQIKVKKDAEHLQTAIDYLTINLKKVSARKPNKKDEK
jgi:hypothetical protein